jgi:hypothetical protein
MGVTNEMISANVRNWLQDLAIGAKAMNKEIMCGVAESGEEWKIKASTYADVMHDGIITVHIHNIERVAEAAELDLQHRDFTPVDEYYAPFTGEDFFIFNGVKFSDMIHGHFSDEEEERRDEERENEGEQSSNSESFETESMDNE